MGVFLLYIYIVYEYQTDKQLQLNHSTEIRYDFNKISTSKIQQGYYLCIENKKKPINYKT